VYVEEMCDVVVGLVPESGQKVQDVQGKVG
jgi:hypothetical protein